MHRVGQHQRKRALKFAGRPIHGSFAKYAVPSGALMNRSAPPGPIVPVLIYDDAAKAAEWLSAAFGFTERLRTPAQPDGTIHHTQLAVGRGSVILTGDRGRTATHSGSLMVYVDDVDAHFERARVFGAKILRPPATHPFGERQYTAEDFAGYEWTFS